MLANVKAHIIEAEHQDLPREDVLRLVSFQRQLEKAKASKISKRAGGKNTPTSLLETSRRVAAKTKPPRSRKGGLMTKDTPAWSDTRGYHARSPREQPAAVKATTREIPEMDDEMEVDTEDDEGSAHVRVRTTRARSTASPALVEAMGEDEDDERSADARAGTARARSTASPASAEAVEEDED